MKKIFLVSLALASSMAFAADVDYSRCTMLGGVQLDHDGKVVPNQFQTIKSQRTDGNKEHIVFESSFGSKKFQNEITIERDAQGRVVKSTMGGERPSDKMLQEYRESMVNSAVAMAPFTSGAGFGSNNVMTQEPTYWVKKKKAANTESTPAQTTGGMVGGAGGGWGQVDPNYEMVPLSKLTRDQAQEAGLEDVEELKRLKQQWRRDRRTANRLRSGYEKIVERSSLVIPMGTETEFEIQDGVCLPKKISSRFYNSQSGQVNTFPISSKEKCDKIRTVYQKHQRKINECNATSMDVSKDYFKEMYGAEGGMVAGAQGGYIGGFPGTGMGVYPAGGIAGGVVGGMMAGGMMGGMYGGMYPGMYGMGFMGSDMNSVAMQNSMCEWTYSLERTQSQSRRSQDQARPAGSEVEQQ